MGDGVHPRALIIVKVIRVRGPRVEGHTLSGVSIVCPIWSSSVLLLACREFYATTAEEEKSETPRLPILALRHFTLYHTHQCIAL
jgi:hypothetical protein